MKEIFLFLKWNWDKWGSSHRVYMLGAFCVGCGLPDAVKGSGPNIMMMIGFALWVSILLKWFVIERVIDSWKAYKKEKAELFQVIKGDQ